MIVYVIILCSGSGGIFLQGQVNGAGPAVAFELKAECVADGVLTEDRFEVADRGHFGVVNGDHAVSDLKAYQGTESDVVIREKFLSYDVTAVESFAFFRNETIQTLSLYDATMLNSLLPGASTSLGNSVFDGCTSLYEVRFRDGSAAQIPAQAFFECASLETVLFENDVTSIGNRAFSGCTSLEYVEIPKSVTTIAASAFDNCPALTLGVWYGSCAYDYAKQNHIPYVLLDGVSLGDANGDGYVNINDVTAIQRHLSELEALQGICLLAADVNQNGTQEIDDATHLQAYLAEYDIPDPIGEVITQ